MTGSENSLLSEAFWDANVGIGVGRDVGGIRLRLIPNWDVFSVFIKIV